MALVTRAMQIYLALEMVTEAEGLPFDQESKEQMRVESRQELPVSYCRLILLFAWQPILSL